MKDRRRLVKTSNQSTIRITPKEICTTQQDENDASYKRENKKS